MSAGPAPASTGAADASPPTFGTWLADRPDEALVDLLTTRPDVSVPPPADFEVLARRLSAAASVARALERVDRFGLELLDVLVLLDGPTTAAEVADEIDVPTATVERTLDRLRALGLLWGDDEVALPRGVADEVGPHPLGLGRSAAQLLRVEFVPEERAILAETLGLQAGAAGRAEPASLAAFYADPARVDALLTDVEGPERALLSQLAEGAPVGSTSSPVEIVPLAEARTAVGRLLARGLLMPAGGDLVELPREVASALRRAGGAPAGETVRDLVAGRLHPDPPPLEGQQLSADDVDAGAATAAAELLRRLDALLGRWEDAPPVLTRSGGLPVRELRGAAKDLDLPVDVVAVLAELLRAARLVGETPGTDTAISPTEYVDEWRELGNADRWAVVADAWLGLEAFPGLATSVQPQLRRALDGETTGKPLPVFSWDLRRPGAVAARREVLEILAGAPVGLAARPEAVAEQLHWQGPRRNRAWWDTVVTWTLIEADLVGVTGRGALGSAGRALLGDGVEAAARALAAHLPAPVDHLLIQGDLTAIAPGPLEPALAREIGLVADVESSGAATVFRFSEASVRRALDAGWSGGDVQALIARTARGPVPQSLTYLVDDVARRHGRLRAGSIACYLRCDDPALLAEVVAARGTGAVGLRQVAPTVAVSAAPLDRVLEVLRRSGYSPVGEGADGAVRVEVAAHERVPVPVRRRIVGPSGVSVDHLRATVARLRRAQSAIRTAQTRSGELVPEGEPVRLPGEVLVALAGAVDAGRAVQIAYVNLEGRSSLRVVHPLLLSGGYLTAYDEQTGERRTFAVSRISALVVLAD